VAVSGAGQSLVDCGTLQASGRGNAGPAKPWEHGDRQAIAESRQTGLVGPAKQVSRSTRLTMTATPLTAQTAKWGQADLRLPGRRTAKWGQANSRQPGRPAASTPPNVAQCGPGRPSSRLRYQQQIGLRPLPKSPDPGNLPKSAIIPAAKPLRSLTITSTHSKIGKLTAMPASPPAVTYEREHD